MIDLRSNEKIIKQMRITEHFFEDTGLFMIFAYSRNNQVGVLKGHIDGYTAYLGDIDIPERYVSIGIGSKLLNVFENKCQLMGVKEIDGDLSNVDLDHKGRLLHFYEKNGYKIFYGNDEKPGFWGKIHKQVD